MQDYSFNGKLPHNKSAFTLQYFISLLLLLVCFTAGAQPVIQPNGPEARKYFVATLIKIADPVLVALSQNRLKQDMPIETAINPFGDRDKVTYLEAFGRTLSGIAPWLELGSDNTEEGKLREKYIQLTLKGIANATNPSAPDYMNFTDGGQPLVDAAFFAQGLLRAPHQLWDRLDTATQQNVLQALKATRPISPVYSNWLLFTGTIEAALLKFEGKADMVRLEYALQKHNEWYLGDGMYGDGPDFHWDYYNSYVIQPMLLDILAVLKDKRESLKDWRYRNDFIDGSGIFTGRARRYAEIQERLISPEGTYPAIGRSIAYRVGAFQSLSQMALKQELPANINPAQVRCALYAVVKKQMEAPGTFDSKDWLTIGFYGHQQEIAEGYISTGSLYLCTEAFLVLGLPPQTEFWAAPPALYTQQQIWGGYKAPIDHAYYGTTERDKRVWETVLDTTSFTNDKALKQQWNYFYPWGTDHNGSARMYKKQISIKDNLLQLKAIRTYKKEGKSTSDPFLDIKYHSGAIHSKHQITVNKEYPEYIISGQFKAPVTSGTWPAFWLTAVNGWPPESDILEYKGDAINWQNTFITPQNVTTVKTTLTNASIVWHTYTARLKMINSEHTVITYYIDGEKKGEHYTNFTNKPLWLIVNLQMEGSSGSQGLETETNFYAKNISIKRIKAN
jgi:hypothetical protein